jgi:hypothetical protein
MANVWEAVIDGHDFDLLDWKQTLLSGFDPWVEIHPIAEKKRYILMSEEFTGAKDVGEVREKALILIAKLNGVFLTNPGMQPVTFSGVAEFFPDGTIGLSSFAMMVGAMGRSRVSAVATTGNAQPPSASYAQKWMKLAAQNDLVADTLIHQSKGANWYDLYKTFEGVRSLCGGKLEKKSWAPPNIEINRFTHTANNYRHGLTHPSNAKPPSNPMSLNEASQMIARMVSSILNELTN